MPCGGDVAQVAGNARQGRSKRCDLLAAITHTAAEELQESTDSEFGVRAVRSKVFQRIVSSSDAVDVHLTRTVTRVKLIPLMRQNTACIASDPARHTGLKSPLSV